MFSTLWRAVIAVQCRQLEAEVATFIEHDFPTGICFQAGTPVEAVAGFQVLFDGSLQRDLLGKLKVTDTHGVDVPGAPVVPVALPQDRASGLLHNMHLQLEVVHLYSCVPAKQRTLATNLEHFFAACIEVLPESGLSGLQTVFLKEIVPVVRGTLASL